MLYLKNILIAVAVALFSLNASAREPDGGSFDTTAVVGNSGIGGTVGFKGQDHDPQGYLEGGQISAGVAVNGRGAVLPLGSAGFYVAPTDQKGIGFAVGDPMLVHTNGQHLFFGLDPAILMNVLYQGPNTQLLASPKIMGVYDIKNQVWAYSGGFQVVMQHRFNDDLRAAVAAVAGPAWTPGSSTGAGYFAMLKVELDKRLNKNVFGSIGAETSDMTIPSDSQHAATTSPAAQLTVAIKVN